MTGTTEFRGDRGGDGSVAWGGVGSLVGVGSSCCAVDDAGIEELEIVVGPEVCEEGEIVGSEAPEFRGDTGAGPDALAVSVLGDTMGGNLYSLHQLIRPEASMRPVPGRVVLVCPCNDSPEV